MKIEISADLHVWEKRFAYGLMVSTPLVISWISYDTFLLPKFVWIICFAALWLLTATLLSAWKPWIVSPIDAPIIGLLACFVVSIAIRYHSLIQFYTLLVLLSFIALLYLYRRIWSLGLPPETVTWCLMAVAVVLSVYGLLQDYGFDFVNYAGGVRDWRAKVIATLGNPNFLGGYLAVGLPLFAAFALRTELSWLKYILSLISIMLMVACLTVTFCVGATLGLMISAVVGVCVAFYLKAWPKMILVRSILLALAIICSIGWYFADNPYNSHGRSLVSEAMESAQWRTGMGARNFNWRTTRIMMDEEPLFGIGYGNYLAKHIHYQGLNYQRYGTVHDRDYVIPVDQPHFQMLETASETGPVGVILICWLFTAWWRCALSRLRAAKEPWFAWGAFLGVMVAVGHSFSSFPFHLPATSLLVVVLAAYFLKNPRIHYPQTQQQSFMRVFVSAVGAFVVIVIAGSIYLSDVYLRNGNETQGYTSIVNLQTARRLDPFQYRVHQLLGIRYIQTGQYNKAIESLHEALRYQEDQTTHRYLARIYESQGKWKEAIEEQRLVIELNPMFPGHYRELAELLRKSGQTDEIDALEQKAERMEEEMKKKY